MKLRHLVVSVGIACVPRLASAGGLFLPGAGAVSMSRAGAAVASSDDGEALVLNPAGIAKAHGNTITISAAMIEYAMTFQRRGSYDAVPGQDYAYAGAPFAAVRNDARPPLGIGRFQPLPVVAFLTDLGGRLGNLHLGIGLYAPSGYPFRDMCTELPEGCQKYVFNRDTTAPPGTRYDIMKQEAAITLPSIAAAYRVRGDLDVGVRLSAGQARIKSTTALWATLQANYEEDIAKDGVFSLDAKDNFVFGAGLGVAFRPSPHLEIGASYSSELDIHSKGTSTSVLGPQAGLPPLPVTIGPTPDDRALCAKGGTSALQNVCVDFALPMTAQLGASYKFLDAAGGITGDVELDLGWENWGKSCAPADFASGTCTSPGDYRVVADSSAFLAGQPFMDLKQSVVKHGLRDSYSVRVGGSYHVAVGARPEHGPATEVILRGGVGYDTAAASQGWLRADLDGAARTTLTVGAAYRTRRFELDAGGGVILEGSPSNPNVGGGAQPCNPTEAAPTCSTGDHQGPDPINPLQSADRQVENPVAQGDYKAHYVMLMLGVTTWF